MDTGSYVNGASSVGCCPGRLKEWKTFNNVASELVSAMKLFCIRNDSPVFQDIIQAFLRCVTILRDHHEDNDHFYYRGVRGFSRVQPGVSSSVKLRQWEAERVSGCVSQASVNPLFGYTLEGEP